MKETLKDSILSLTRLFKLSMLFLQHKRLIQIKFFTSVLDSAYILATALRAIEKISAISYYQLNLMSFYEIQLNTFLQQDIRIAIKKNGRSRYIHGKISSVSKSFSPNSSGYHYKITIQSILSCLNQAIDSRIFHQKNIQELCQLLFKEHRLESYQFKLIEEHKIYLSQTQYNESALNFLNRLFNKEGIFYYIIHLKNNSRLILSDGLEGYHFNNYSILFEMGQHHDPHIYDWQYHNCTFSTSNRCIKVIAKSDVHTIAPGDVFKLKNHPQKSMVGDYLITKITHYAKDHSTLPPSKNKIIANYKNIIECVPLLKSYPMLIKTIQPKIDGIQVAKILEAEDDNHAHNINGQVRVLFPWDHRKSGSSFISVKQPLADQSVGLQFFPKAGDKVVVAFEQGNPNKPIILGSIYSQKNCFPLSLYSHGLKTCHGHELSFCNKAQHKKIIVKSMMNMRLSIKGNHMSEVENNFSFDIKNGPLTIKTQAFQTQATRSIKFKSANGSIEITPNKITLTGIMLLLN